MGVKDVAREICPAPVWRVLMRAKERARYRDFSLVRKYYGFRYLDRTLAAHLPAKRGGVFIELGANDGVSQNNTLHFERFKGWRGLLIEPSPDQYQRCVKNRPQAKVVQCACVPFEYPEKTVSLVHGDLMSFVATQDGLDSDLEDAKAHVEKAKEFLKPHQSIHSFEAEARPLSDVIDDVELDLPIDLLVLDVEGQELNVLRGLDFARHAPNYMCIEVRNVEAMDQFLEERGYERAAQLSHHDYLYRRPIR